MIISTASESIKLSNKIKKWVSIIDCWLIRWKLWIRWSIPMQREYIAKYNIVTPVPWWIWPFEMLYMVSKIKNISSSDMDLLLKNNIVFSEFNI